MRRENSIPMILYCPRCHKQHIDQPNPDKGWRNPPHATHQCQSCGHEWRPCNLRTTGVEQLPELVK